MMPGEGEVLRQDELAVVVDAATCRKTRRGLGEKIGAGAGGETEVPHFIRPKAGAAAKRGMFETGLGDAPRFRPGGERRIFHFHGVIEAAAGAGDGDATGIARAPDNWKALIFVGVIVIVVFTDVSPFQEFVGLIWGPAVPDASEIFVRQRRVDEWILPGVVARDPVADHGGELSDLEVNVLSWT